MKRIERIEEIDPHYGKNCVYVNQAGFTFELSEDNPVDLTEKCKACADKDYCVTRFGSADDRRWYCKTRNALEF
jgi:hypothetical protein